MSTKGRIFLGAVLILGAFAFGRYSAPEKIKVEKEIVRVEVEKKEKSKDQSVDEQKDTTTIEVTKPDGTKIKKRVVRQDRKTETSTDEKTDRVSQTKKKETKVVENSRRISVSVIAGPNFTDLKAPIVFGGYISRPFMGPVTLGIWGLSSGVGGVSVGLQF